MKITVHGWSRDMGTKVIAEHNLKEMDISRDRDRRISRNTPGLFASFGRVCVAWFQKLQVMGNYRMEIEFSNDDVLQLFKARFGTELREWLIDDEGFTISPELIKRALRTVKLSEVTLADLAAMSVTSADEQATVDKLVESAKITTFPRRV